MSAPGEPPRGVDVGRFEPPDLATEPYRGGRGTGAVSLTCHAPRRGYALVAVAQLGLALLAAPTWDFPHTVRFLAISVFGALALHVFLRAMMAHVLVTLDEGVVSVTDSLRPGDTQRRNASEWNAVESSGGQVVARQAGATHVIAEGLSAEQARYVAGALRAALGLTEAPPPRVRVRGADDSELGDDAAPSRASRVERHGR
jgi:hypothetical protein